MIEEISEHSSEQALGWPLLLSMWGRFAGWSEAAVRTLPLLAGLLTIALLFRCASDMYSPHVGLIAAALLAGSTLFLVYIAVARTFSLVLLFSTLTLWSYWRVALHPGPTGRAAPAGLFIGVLGLLYSHYLGALLIPALGLHYLLFARKTREQLRPALVLLLALSPASLQIPVFARGLQRTLGNSILQGNALDNQDLPALVLYHLGNGLIRPGPVTGIALLLAVPLLITIAVVWRRPAWRRDSVLWLTGFAAFALLAIVLLVNARFQILPTNRIRYLMPLWPLASMAGAIVLARLKPAVPNLFVPCLLGLWLVAGVRASQWTDYRLELDSLAPSTIHRLWRVLDDHTLAGDLLVADKAALDRDPARLYDRWLQMPHRVLDRTLEEPLPDIRDIHLRYPWVWLLYPEEDRSAVLEAIAGLGRVRCDVVYSDGGLVLERHTLGGLDCPGLPDLLVYEDGFSLAGPSVRLNQDLLAVDLLLRSRDAHAFTHYSISLQLIDVASLEGVAQIDVGLGRGTVIPLHAELDLGPLPAGEYALRLALYNWDTGERKIGRDLTLGHVSDVHTLQHIVLE